MNWGFKKKLFWASILGSKATCIIFATSPTECQFVYKIMGGSAVYRTHTMTHVSLLLLYLKAAAWY